MFSAGMLFMALKKFLMVAVVAAVLVACGGNRNSEAHPDGESSLSKNVILSSGEGSCCNSSSVIAGDTIYDTRQLVDLLVELDSKELQSSNSRSSSSAFVAYVAPTTVIKGTMTDERDGKIYKTVEIGTQTWMAENLNYESANSFCYNDSAEYCAKYGRTYTWAVAIDSAGTWSANGKGCGSCVEGLCYFIASCTPTYPVRGVCPEGWHLPDTTEWKTLFTAVGGRLNAGEMLKSTSGWNDNRGENGNGIDAYSFAAFPTVCKHFKKGYFGYDGEDAHFWSSSQHSGSNAYFIRLDNDGDGVSCTHNYKDYGHSVRCLKDEFFEQSSSFGDTAEPSSSSAKSSSSAALRSGIPEGYVDPSTVVKGTMTDERDGQTYKTVKIGTQTWMAENLNYAYTGVPYEFRLVRSDSSSWCYGNDPAKCSKYGRLYTWIAAMDGVGRWSTNGKGCGYVHKEDEMCSPTYPVRGVCPEGWHLPDTTEWKILFSAVGGIYTASKMLKSTSGWGWNKYYKVYGNDVNGCGSDAYSFTALSAGDFYEGYNGEGRIAYFWSSSQYNGVDAHSVSLGYYDDRAHLFINFKDLGLSVRCVKDLQAE